MQQVKVDKAYPGVKVATVIGQPVYDMICELAALNGYSLAQTLRILIRMGLEQLGKEDHCGSDQTDPEAACSAS